MDLILNPDTSVKEATNAAKLPDIGLVYSNIKLATVDHRLRNPEQYPQPVQQLQRTPPFCIATEMLIVVLADTLSRRGPEPIKKSARHQGRDVRQEAVA
jgi:hypothetical protein